MKKTHKSDTPQSKLRLLEEGNEDADSPNSTAIADSWPPPLSLTRLRSDGSSADATAPSTPAAAIPSAASASASAASASAASASAASVSFDECRGENGYGVVGDGGVAAASSVLSPEEQQRPSEALSLPSTMLRPNIPPTVIPKLAEGAANASAPAPAPAPVDGVKSSARAVPKAASRAAPAVAAGARATPRDDADDSAESPAADIRPAAAVEDASQPPPAAGKRSGRFVRRGVSYKRPQQRAAPAKGVKYSNAALVPTEQAELEGEVTAQTKEAVEAIKATRSEFKVSCNSRIAKSVN